MGRQSSSHVDSATKLAKRLREARAAAQLTQRELSFPGCTAAYISRIEAGERVPSLQMVNQLASRLGVSAQWLATGVDALPDSGEIVDAQVALRLDDLDEARRMFRARDSADDPARPAAVAGLGQIALREERYEDAIELLEEALELRGGKTLLDPGAVDSLGRAYAQAGRLEEAIALFARALSEAQAIGALVEEIRFAVLLANSQIDHGTFGAAELTLANVINLADELKDPLAAARVYWSQSRLRAIRGEPQVAARYARRALDILERTENDAYVGMAYHLLAYAEIESGHAKPALELLDRGRALFGEDMDNRVEAKFALEEARALSLARRHKDAAKAGARALELIDFVDPQDRGRAYVALGDVFVAAGNKARAKEIYGEAIKVLRESGRPYVMAAATRLSDLLEVEGDVKGALAVMKRASAHLPNGDVSSRVAKSAR